MYLSTQAGVVSQRVSSSFAVAAIEYSEVLDIMVDPDYELTLGKVLLPPPSSSSLAPPETETLPRSLSAPELTVTSIPSIELSLPGPYSPTVCNLFVADATRLL